MNQREKFLFYQLDSVIIFVTPCIRFFFFLSVNSSFTGLQFPLLSSSYDRLN